MSFAHIFHFFFFYQDDQDSTPMAMTGNVQVGHLLVAMGYLVQSNLTQNYWWHCHFFLLIQTSF